MYWTLHARITRDSWSVLLCTPRSAVSTLPTEMCCLQRKPVIGWEIVGFDLWSVYMVHCLPYNARSLPAVTQLFCIVLMSLYCNIVIYSSMWCRKSYLMYLHYRDMKYEWNTRGQTYTIVHICSTTNRYRCCRAPCSTIAGLVHT